MKKVNKSFSSELFLLIFGINKNKALKIFKLVIFEYIKFKLQSDINS